jgi:hypothetical protein
VSHDWSAQNANRSAQASAPRYGRKRPPPGPPAAPPRGVLGRPSSLVRRPRSSMKYSNQVTLSHRKSSLVISGNPASKRCRPIFTFRTDFGPISDRFRRHILIDTRRPVWNSGASENHSRTDVNISFAEPRNSLKTPFYLAFTFAAALATTSGGAPAAVGATTRPNAHIAWYWTGGRPQLSTPGL